MRHFLRNPLNQQLPRKFKISFSGCESDCAQGMIHDLGIVAVRRREGGGERFGFKVLAGGGLGHKPHEAIVVEPFIEEHELVIAMEAIVTLHNKHSDRVKRAKSRIKFLVDRFGAEGFVEQYREEFARIKEALGQRRFPPGEWRAGQPGAAPGPGAPRKPYAQKQPGLVGAAGSAADRQPHRRATARGRRPRRASRHRRDSHHAGPEPDARWTFPMRSWGSSSRASSARA